MKLAIVIPAFKAKFFPQALSSLARQTNKNFTVYVGDDNSPEDLKSICDGFESSLNIKYTRFKDNIGAENIVKQWTRCVELTMGEEWIWLFSDDDIVDENCVESFYKKVNSDNGAFDVYRFNNTVIDGDNNVIYETPRSPSYESSEEMAYNLLLGQRGNSMADHIFSRNVYNLSGGFVYTKYAQGADWATSILFSKNKGMAVISEGNFYWRYSKVNISSTAWNIRNKTIEGHLQFIKWIATHFTYLKNSRSSITYQMMIDAAASNLISVIIEHYKGFSNRHALRLALFMHQVLDFSYFKALKTLLHIKVSTSPETNILNKIIRILKKFSRYTSALPAKINS